MKGFILVFATITAASSLSGMIQLAVREIDTKQKKALQYKMLPVSLEKMTLVTSTTQ